MCVCVCVRVCVCVCTIEGIEGIMDVWLLVNLFGCLAKHPNKFRCGVNLFGCLASCDTCAFRSDGSTGPVQMATSGVCE